MNLADLTREKELCAIIAERDQMILSLHQESVQLHRHAQQLQETLDRMSQEKEMNAGGKKS